MKKVLVILGPTATGKTDLALQLARKFQGELISCDSRQVYQGLDIGTGKEPGGNTGHPELDSGSIVKMPNQVRHDIKKRKGLWEINGIKIWMYDVADPKKQYSVADYVEQASRAIEDILKRKKLPIIVGGTGLYLKALLYGLPNLAIPIDRNLRGELEELSLQKLQNKLKSLSPTKWENLNESDRQNKRRLLRSIELILMYGYKNTIKNVKCIIKNYKVLKIGLTAPRQVLYDKIDKRLLSRIDQGLIEEAGDLQRGGLSLKRMRELGLEYGVLADLLAGTLTREQFIERLKIKIHQYAKRQMTWFKKENDVFWFENTFLNWQKEVEKRVTSWYYQTNDQKN